MAEKPIFQVVDPSSGTPGRSYEGQTRDEALAIARASRQAFEGWRRTSFAERGALMAKAAAVLRARADEFTGLMTDEMGKTLTEGRAEIEKCAGHCEFYAERAEGFLA